MSVLLCDIFNGRSSSVKEKKIWRNALTVSSKKVQGVFGGNIYIGIIVFSGLSSTKPCLRFLLNCFVQDIKGFYQSSLGNKVDFRDIMNVSLNILAKNLNFKKLRHCLVDEGTMIRKQH